MSKYVSKDKKTINLPFPLGTKLYMPITTCGDFCLYQKDLFNEIFPKDSENQGRCSRDMPCHTKLHSIKEITFSMSNLEMVLENLDKWIFTSEHEAQRVIEKRLESNRWDMTFNGFHVDNNGYGSYERRESKYSEIKTKIAI